MNFKKIIRTPEERTELIKALNEDSLDKPLSVEVKLYRKPRSCSQNNLMWLWLRCIRDETGNDVDTLYYYFCEKYLPWNENKIFGEGVRMVGGTSQMNTKEFDDFLEKMRMEMLNEQNIHLPLPDEQGFNEFYERYHL